VGKKKNKLAERGSDLSAPVMWSQLNPKGNPRLPLRGGGVWGGVTPERRSRENQYDPTKTDAKEEGKPRPPNFVRITKGKGRKDPGDPAGARSGPGGRKKIVKGEGADFPHENTVRLKKPIGKAIFKPTQGGKKKGNERM